MNRRDLMKSLSALAFLPGLPFALPAVRQERIVEVYGRCWSYDWVYNYRVEFVNVENVLIAMVKEHTSILRIAVCREHTDGTRWIETFWHCESDDFKWRYAHYELSERINRPGEWKFAPYLDGLPHLRNSIDCLPLSSPRTLLRI